jgi:hypothetical protein
MDEHIMDASRLLLLSARITGTLLLLFLLLVLIGGVSGDASDPINGSGTFGHRLGSALLYPLAVMAGLALAYRRPLVGGLIATLALVLTVILDPQLFQATFFVMLVPGLLYMFTAWSSNYRSAHH